MTEFIGSHIKDNGLTYHDSSPRDETDRVDPDIQLSSGLDPISAEQHCLLRMNYDTIEYELYELVDSELEKKSTSDSRTANNLHEAMREFYERRAEGRMLYSQGKDETLGVTSSILSNKSWESVNMSAVMAKTVDGLFRRRGWRVKPWYDLVYGSSPSSTA